MSDLDEKESSKFNELFECLSKLVRNEETAFRIIWFEISDFMVRSEIGSPSDCIADLQRKITGTSVGNIWWEVSEQSVDYCKIKDDYKFDKSVDEMGDFWKNLIKEEKVFRLRLLEAFLVGFYSEIIPFVFDFVSDWERTERIEPTSSSQEKKRKKIYRDYRKNLRESLQIVKTAEAIISLKTE